MQWYLKKRKELCAVRKLLKLVGRNYGRTVSHHACIPVNEACSVLKNDNTALPVFS